jgi:hypothetical protein
VFAILDAQDRFDRMDGFEIVRIGQVVAGRDQHGQRVSRGFLRVAFHCRGLAVHRTTVAVRELPGYFVVLFNLFNE